jgi:hypothetical protein
MNLHGGPAPAAQEWGAWRWRRAGAVVLDERWRWMRGGGGNPLLFTPVASPDGGGGPVSSLFALFAALSDIPLICGWL